jgi:chaperone BCS1
MNGGLSVSVLVLAVSSVIFAIAYKFQYFGDMKTDITHKDPSYFESIFKSIFQNELLTGIIFIGILGSVASTCYYVLNELWHIFLQNFVVTLTMNNSQEPFEWFMQFLAQEMQNSNTFITSPTVKLKFEHAYNNWGDKIEEDLTDEEFSKKLTLEPGSGFHVIRFKNTIFWFTRQPSPEMVSTGWENQPFLFETCSISTLALNKSHKAIQDLLHTAQANSRLMQHKDKTKIYVPGDLDGWKVAFARTKRPFDSVVLDDDLANRILDDAKRFLVSSEWYRRKGTPFRRGYLLYGPPGCGKSSFVLAIAGMLNLSICVLTLSNPELDDNRLNIRLHEAPMNSIILLEDVDAIFLDRNTPLKKGDIDQRHVRGVTFSGLLNAIDGVASQEDGKLLFMTTNHIEKLDPALIRPGRCDVKIEFRYASKQQIGTYFAKFYSSETDITTLTEEFLSFLPEKSLSITMAHLQGHLLCHKNNPRGAINNIQQLLVKDHREEEHLPVEQWLTRLGLAKYISSFKRQKIKTLNDMKGISSYQLLTFGVKKYGEKKRILDMLSGKKDTVREFQLATKAEIKRIFLQYYADHSAASIFVENVPNHTVSTLQLRNYLHTKCLLQHKSATEAANNINIQNELLQDKQADIITFKHESVQDFLTRLNNMYHWWNDMQEESTDKEQETTFCSLVKKLNSEHIIDVSQMCQLSDSDLSDTYLVKKKGRRLKILRHLTTIKEEIEKAQKATETAYKLENDIFDD